MMAVFMVNICKFDGCGIIFQGLGDLIQHIEESHIGNWTQILASTIPCSSVWDVLGWPSTVAIKSATPCTVLNSDCDPIILLA